MTDAKKPATPKPADDRVGKLEKQIAAMKDVMRANGWTLPED